MYGNYKLDAGKANKKNFTSWQVVFMPPDSMTFPAVFLFHLILAMLDTHTAIKEKFGKNKCKCRQWWAKLQLLYSVTKLSN
jgi:hypothetical protein